MGSTERLKRKAKEEKIEISNKLTKAFKRFVELDTTKKECSEFEETITQIEEIFKGLE